MRIVELVAPFGAEGEMLSARSRRHSGRAGRARHREARAPGPAARDPGFALSRAPG
ncbi:hypothetical protein JQ543_17115 [Bradyrhizobium diazoefficiens]|nr:hypothetical protein [Bradyrhizobium diazoefficiens]MBR0849476.1 hypothetical protein [Bradyrhizobium diazoefficiens]